MAEGEDELENVRVAELKAREKARAASKKGRKANPFAEAEEEAAGAVLGKYDDAAPDEAMQLDEAGAIDAAKARACARTRHLSPVGSPLLRVPPFWAPIRGLQTAA